MDRPALGAVPTIVLGTQHIERKIAFFVQLSPLRVLNDDIGEGELFTVHSVHLCFSVECLAVDASIGVIVQSALCIAEHIGKVNGVRADRCGAVLGEIIRAILYKVEMSLVVVVRAERQRIAETAAGFYTLTYCNNIGSPLWQTVE